MHILEPEGYSLDPSSDTAQLCTLARSLRLSEPQLHHLKTGLDSRASQGCAED